MATTPATFTNDSGVEELRGTLTTSGTQTGNQTITGTLSVTGAAGFGSTLQAQGAATLASLIVTPGSARFDGALDHDGTTVGFYGTAPITKQTGVAVDAAGIHAALVALGLIAA